MLALVRVQGAGSVGAKKKKVGGKAKRNAYTHIPTSSLLHELTHVEDKLNHWPWVMQFFF